MNYYTRIVDGLAVEVIPATIEVDGVDVPLSERFHPDFLAQLVPYDPEHPPPPPALTLADLQRDLILAATEKRWEVETGGIMLPSGIRVGTAKADQDRVTSVVANAPAAGITDVDFKAASGWVSLSLAQVGGIATAISLHVQACFSAERAHHEAISALASVETALSYDINAGWPA